MGQISSRQAKKPCKSRLFLLCLDAQQAHGHGANVPYAIAQPHLKLHELLENPDQPVQIH